MSALLYSNYFTALSIYTAANPLDSFTGEYNSDEEVKGSVSVTRKEGKDAVNENHVEQFMQVSDINFLTFSRRC